MNAITFQIELHEPLLATQIQNGEANSSISYPFIPGSMIRGAIIGRYLTSHPVRDVDKDEQFRHLFLSGKVCYLNGYPHANQLRALPKPLSWFCRKDEADDPAAEIYDFAHEPQTGEPFKSPSQGQFVGQTSESVWLGSPRMIGLVHNTSTDPNRKDEKNSQVYRYEALAPGQTFGGAIVAEDAGLLAEIETLLKAGYFNLGGSYTAGYGRVAITNIILETNWQEFTPITAYQERYDEDDNLDDAGEFFRDEPSVAIVTCLSDLIWRDVNGQVNGALKTPAGGKPTNAFYRLRPVGGFNRKWGLPLPQAWAVQAGSVFVFPPECYQELTTWVVHGVGERRAEGFGRVALNWQGRKQIQQSAWPDLETAVPHEPMSTDSQQIAQDMANRQLQALVDQQLVVRIQELSQFRALPKPVHLSRARLAARRAWQMGNLQEIGDYFAGLSPTAVKQWERAKVSNQSLRQWILNEMKRAHQFNLGIELPKVAGIEAQFAPIRQITLARLIEGILRQAVKQAKRREEEGEQDES